METSRAKNVPVRTIHKFSGENPLRDDRIGFFREADAGAKSITTIYFFVEC